VVGTVVACMDNAMESFPRRTLDKCGRYVFATLRVVGWSRYVPKV
jgi:hypothetical protein